jgi:uncharacterized LabA/DUF88 family protein
MPSHDYNSESGGRGELVAVFIDGSNLYHSLEENCGRYDVDFGTFSNKLCGNRDLVRTYYYNVLRDPNRTPQAYQDQQKFLTALHSTPYLDVRLGSSKLRGDMAVEKGVDIMIATDMLKLGWDNLYDTAILVSGDGDFAYAVQTVKNMGKHVEVAAFRPNLSAELMQAADSLQAFTPDYFSDIWNRRRNQSRDRDRDNSNGGAQAYRRPPNASPWAQESSERLRPEDFVGS